MNLYVISYLVTVQNHNRFEINYGAITVVANNLFEARGRAIEYFSTNEQFANLQQYPIKWGEGYQVSQHLIDDVCQG